MRGAAWIVLAALGACAGSQTEVQEVGRSDAELDAACGDYARSLCEELGPSSEACRSAISVVALLPKKACGAGLDEFAATRERIAGLRDDCKAVAERVCAELGQDSEACAGIRRDLPEIPPGHCGALKRDATRLVAALRERLAAAGPVSEEAWQRLLEGSPPGFGSPNAAVTVVEFSDFQCPYCAEAARTVHKLKERYGERVRFVFRNFPLSFHPNAHDAARAALAAHAQGKFWALHDRLFENQEALGPDALAEHAKAVGLDAAAYRQAFDGAARGQVDADMRLGEEVHVRGTPTLFVNRQRVENALDFDAVAEVIDAALGGAAAPATAPAAPTSSGTTPPIPSAR